MAQSVEVRSEREPVSQLLGLSLFRTSWRLFTAHWWQLVAIAACSYVAHNLVMRLALLAYRGGALPGLLVFSLVPLVPLVAIVLMLLVLRRRQDRGGFGAFIAAIGSVLIPFLVVYENQGDFNDDLSEFLLGGFNQISEQQTALALSGAETDPGAYDSLVPDGANPLVVGVVVVAFLLRALGARLAEKDALWEPSTARRVVRVTLRSLVGYAEIVWIVIGAVVINTTLKGLHDWWQQRRLGRSLAEVWDSLSTSFPTFGAFGEWLASAVGTVLDGVVTGVVTPLAWLTIGVVIYGLSAAESISEDEVVAAMQQQSRFKRVTERVNPAVITLAWRRIADTEGHFGALLGGVAMILRSRFVPVLVFCLLYTALTTWLPYLLWDVARIAFPRFHYLDWLALYSPLQALSHILTLCVTAPLLAAWTDALLTRFGARSQLRLPEA